MYYCNDLLSLSVLSLYEGELLGRVEKIYLDKKLKKVMELELIGENDTRYILPAKNIYHIGKNAITVKNNLAVNLKVETGGNQTAPIGAKAYSIKGEFLGVIKELSLDDNFSTIKFSLDNNTTLNVEDLASCGKNTIIFYEKNDNVNVSKFKSKKTPKLFKSDVTVTAKILPQSEEKPHEIIKSAPAIETSARIFEIKSNVQNAEFLIGRVCTKDIFNFNNEILIKAHSIINQKNLKEVNKFGKLRELMLYSK